VKLWYKPNTKKALFFIDMDIVETDKNDLFEIINNYRTKASQIEQF
jgi:hypothetical protein